MFELSLETAWTRTRPHSSDGWSALFFASCLMSAMIVPQFAFAQSRVPTGDRIGEVTPRNDNLTSGSILITADQPAAAPPQDAQGDPTEQDAAHMVLSMLMALDPYQAKETQAGKLAVFGTPTMGALAHRWSEGFKRFHPKAEIEISEMKGPEILKRLGENPNGVAMISRPLSSEDFDELKKAGLSNPIQIEVGKQGLGVFVHSANPLRGIDRQQFLQIFTQELDPTKQALKPNVSATAATETKVQNQGQNPSIPQSLLTWGEIGLTGEWASRPVHIICRDISSGTHSYLKNHLIEDREVRAAKEICDSAKELLETISRDPNAIGIANFRSTMSDVKTLKLLDGTQEISCNDYSILTGAYPLVRKITLVVDSKSDAGMQLAKEFVKFTICQDGQRETIVAGFFPLDPPLIRAQKLQLESDHLEQEQGKKE